MFVKKISKNVLVLLTVLSLSFSGLAIPKQAEAGFVTDAIAGVAICMGPLTTALTVLTAAEAALGSTLSFLGIGGSTGIRTSFSGVFSDITSSQWKECVLEPALNATKNAILEETTNVILKKSQNLDNIPGRDTFVENFGKYFQSSIDEEVNKVLYDNNLDFLCDGFAPLMKNMLQARFFFPSNIFDAQSLKTPSLNPARCSLSSIREDWEEDIEDWEEGKYKDYTWRDFTDVMVGMDTNNPFKVGFDLQSDLLTKIRRIGQEEKDEVDRNKGFLSMKHCVRVSEADINAWGENCLKSCRAKYGDSSDLQDKFDKCIQDCNEDVDENQNCSITTPGVFLHETMSKALGAGFENLQLADEFDEIFVALVGYLQAVIFNPEKGYTGIDTNQSSFYDNPAFAVMKRNIGSSVQSDSRTQLIESGLALVSKADMLQNAEYLANYNEQCWGDSIELENETLVGLYNILASLPFGDDIDPDTIMRMLSKLEDLRDDPGDDKESTISSYLRSEFNTLYDELPAFGSGSMDRGTFNLLSGLIIHNIKDKLLTSRELENLYLKGSVFDETTYDFKNYHRITGQLSIVAYIEDLKIRRANKDDNWKRIRGYLLGDRDSFKYSDAHTDPDYASLSLEVIEEQKQAWAEAVGDDAIAEEAKKDFLNTLDEIEDIRRRICIYDERGLYEKIKARIDGAQNQAELEELTKAYGDVLFNEDKYVDINEVEGIKYGFERSLNGLKNKFLQSYKGSYEVCSTFVNRGVTTQPAYDDHQQHRIIKPRSHATISAEDPWSFIPAPWTEDCDSEGACAPLWECNAYEGLAENEGDEDKGVCNRGHSCWEAAAELTGEAKWEAETACWAECQECRDSVSQTDINSCTTAKLECPIASLSDNNILFSEMVDVNNSGNGYNKDNKNEQIAKAYINTIATVNDIGLLNEESGHPAVDYRDIEIPMRSVYSVSPDPNTWFKLLDLSDLSDDRREYYENWSCEENAPSPLSDEDEDNIPFAEDNCPYTPNGRIEERDESNNIVYGEGGKITWIYRGTCISGPNKKDSCSSDVDCGIIRTDGELHTYGSCSSNQEDSDNDGVGDACELDDRDGDGIPDTIDKCPDDYDPRQIDSDGDGKGDACELDDSEEKDNPFDDGDGVDLIEDNCPYTYNPDQGNSDGDQWGDACDECPNGYDKYYQGQSGCLSSGAGSQCETGDALCNKCMVSPSLSVCVEACDEDVTLLFCK